MGHRNPIFIFFVFLVRFLVVVGVTSSLSCSDDHDSAPPPATQPPPIWSTHVQHMVDWGPDLFGVGEVKTAGERIYVWGGTTDSGGVYNYTWVAAFSSITGSLSPEFGDDGKLVITDLSFPRGLEVAGSSLFLLAERPFASDVTEPYNAGRLQERDAVDGSWIRTTLCGPVMLFESGVPNSHPLALALGADSAFLLFDDPVVSIFRLERRLLVDGALVDTFGTGGEVTTDRNDVGKLTLYGNSIFILRGGRGPFPWEIEKRNIITGELDASFGIGGVVVSQAGEVGQPVGLASDSSGIYVLVKTDRFVLSKRSLSDGTLIGSFGDQGLVGTEVDQVSPTELALDNGTLFVAATHRLTSTDSEWRIEAFDSLDGERISGFGLNGVMSRNLSDGDDTPGGIAADATGVYVAGKIRPSTSGLWPSDVQVEKYSRGD